MFGIRSKVFGFGDRGYGFLFLLFSSIFYYFLLFFAIGFLLFEFYIISVAVFI